MKNCRFGGGAEKGSRVERVRSIGLFRERGRAMQRSIALIAMTSLIASPVLAAPRMNPSKMQQISEVVFKNYPPRALANGEQGAVYFVVTLDQDAHPTACQVTHGSGHPLLDQETCDLILEHAVFKSVKDASGRATKTIHEGVVNWRIPGAAPAPVTPVALTAATAPEKKICKKTVRNGTLAAVERTCLTQREWDRAMTETQEHWGELQGRRGMTTCPAEPC
jgi:periplasmic protein TonB